MYETKYRKCSLCTQSFATWDLWCPRKTLIGILPCYLCLDRIASKNNKHLNVTNLLRIFGNSYIFRAFSRKANLPTKLLMTVLPSGKNYIFREI